MHRVLTSVLKRHCNPFEGCWPELESPLSFADVQHALGCYVDWIVTDGNHRLAAAIFVLETRGEDRPLPANIGGQLSHAKKLGL